MKKKTKLFIFGIWEGYVRVACHPIVAENEIEAKKILEPYIKHIMERRDPKIRYVNDFEIQANLPLKKGYIESLFHAFDG